MKIKIREELKDGLGKNTLLSAEDAKLINDFLKKVKSELEKNWYLSFVRFNFCKKPVYLKQFFSIS